MCAIYSDVRRRNDPPRERLMGDEKAPLCEWFRIVTAVLRREDLFLRRCLQPYAEGAYRGWSHGIINIYETTIAYLLIRELWSIGYPRVVSLEHPYPGGLNARADLAIFDQRPVESVNDCTPKHVIEIKKMWFRDCAAQGAVWEDILKVLRFEKVCHRYVLLLIFGPDGMTLKDEVVRLQERRIGNQTEQYTMEKLMEKIGTNVELRPWYAQHFDKVNEILWEEFETRIGKNKPGRVRVSLVEVFRRD
jgi:hypothetical protein